MVENESRSSVSSDWSRLAWIHELVQELKDQMQEEKLMQEENLMRGRV